MNPVLFLAIAGFSKKQVYFVLATVTLIIAMPIIGVLSLGQSALSVLDFVFGSDGDSSLMLYQGPISTTITYDWGNCTYWAALLRQQAGDPIPNTWGNAATWAANALLQGYVVDHTPAPGAIMQISNVDHGLGHVAYVTAVDASTGSWMISEMNVKGLDVVDTQTLPASAAQDYNFIHDKEQ